MEIDTHTAIVVDPQGRHDAQAAMSNASFEQFAAHRHNIKLEKADFAPPMAPQNDYQRTDDLRTHPAISQEMRLNGDSSHPSHIIIPDARFLEYYNGPESGIPQDAPVYGFSDTFNVQKPLQEDLVWKTLPQLESPFGVIHRHARLINDTRVQQITFPVGFEYRSRCCKENECLFLFNDAFVSDYHIRDPDAIAKHESNMLAITYHRCTVDAMSDSFINALLFLLNGVVQSDFRQCETSRIYKSCSSPHDIQIFPLDFLYSQFPKNLYETAEFLYRKSELGCMLVNRKFNALFQMPLGGQINQGDFNFPSACRNSCRTTFEEHEFRNGIQVSGSCESQSLYFTCLHFDILPFFEKYANGFRKFLASIPVESLSVKSKVIESVERVLGQFEEKVNKTFKSRRLEPFYPSMKALFVFHDLFVSTLIQGRFTPCSHLHENGFSQFKEGLKHSLVSARSPIFQNRSHCTKCVFCKHGEQISSCLEEWPLIYLEQRKKHHFVCKYRNPNDDRLTQCRPNVPGSKLEQYIVLYYRNEIMWDDATMMYFCKLIKDVAEALLLLYKCNTRTFLIQKQICYFDSIMTLKKPTHSCNDKMICPRNPFLKQFKKFSDFTFIAQKLSDEYSLARIHYQKVQSFLIDFLESEKHMGRIYIRTVTLDHFYNFLHTLNLGKLAAITGHFLSENEQHFTLVKKFLATLLRVELDAFKDPSQNPDLFNPDYSQELRTRSKLDWDFIEKNIDSVKDILSSTVDLSLIKIFFNGSLAELICHPLFEIEYYIYKAPEMENFDEERLEIYKQLAKIDILELLVYKHPLTSNKNPPLQCDKGEKTERCNHLYSHLFPVFKTQFLNKRKFDQIGEEIRPRTFDQNIDLILDYTTSRDYSKNLKFFYNNCKKFRIDNVTYTYKYAEFIEGEN